MNMLCRLLTAAACVGNLLLAACTLNVSNGALLLIRALNSA